MTDTQYTLKYRQDFTRCCGQGCEHKANCQRHEAYTEALNNSLSYGKYILARDCIANDYSEIIVNNDPEVTV